MSTAEIRCARFQAKDGRYAIETHVFISGPDIVLHLSGGDRPHVGAVSLATYVRETGCVTLSSLVSGIHKEKELTERVARDVAQALRCTAVVSAGIHYDVLDREGIATIRSLADEAARQVLTWIRGKGERS